MHSHICHKHDFLLRNVTGNPISSPTKPCLKIILKEMRMVLPCRNCLSIVLPAPLPPSIAFNFVTFFLTAGDFCLCSARTKHILTKIASIAYKLRNRISTEKQKKKKTKFRIQKLLWWWMMMMLSCIICMIFSITLNNICSEEIIYYLIWHNSDKVVYITLLLIYAAHGFICCIQHK